MAAIIGLTTWDRLVPDWVPYWNPYLNVLPFGALLDGTTRLEAWGRLCAEDGVELLLYWRAIEHNNTDYSIFVHALRDGARIAQSDGRPEGGEYPVWRWYGDQVIVTRHFLPLNEATGPADELQVGWYDPATMERADVVQYGVVVPNQAASVNLGDQLGRSFSCLIP